MSGPAFKRDHASSDFVGELLRRVRPSPSSSACREPPRLVSWSIAPPSAASALGGGAADRATPLSSDAVADVTPRRRRPRRRARAASTALNDASRVRDERDASASVAHPLLSSDGKRASRTARAHPIREEPDHLLNVNEAAAMLGLAPTTLRNWAYQRRIPRVKLGGSRGPLRFRVSDVQRFIRASVQGPLGARLAPREVA